jgi:hypothetical protein
LQVLVCAGAGRPHPSAPWLWPRHQWSSAFGVVLSRSSSRGRVLQVNVRLNPYRPHPSAPRLRPHRGDARAPGLDVAPRAVAGDLLAGLRAARACVPRREGEGRGAPQRRAQGSHRRAAADACAGDDAARRGGRQVRERDPVFPGRGRSRRPVGPKRHPAHRGAEEGPKLWVEATTRSSG